MLKRLLTRFLAILLVCLAGFGLAAMAQVTAWQAPAINSPPPAPSGHQIYVTDLGHLLTPDDQALLADQLEKLDRAGIAQVAILTLPRTDRELSEFSPQIINTWHIGQKVKNNGLLILVNAEAIQTHKQRNRIFIGTGSGLEGDLPDITLGKLLDTYAIPNFEAGHYSEGIRAVTLAAAQHVIQASGIQPGEGFRGPEPRHRPEPFWLSIIKILFIILFLWFAFKSRAIYFLGGLGGFGGGGFGGGDDDGGFGGGGGSGGGTGR